MARTKTNHRKSKIENRKSAADFLLEIGAEELPAAYLPDLIKQLSAEAHALFAANHLAFRRVESFGTPRRLVLLVRGLSGVQQKPGEEIPGPPQQASYDKDGKPTLALLGFLRSKGGKIEQTKCVGTERGAYVYLIKPPMEVPTASLLPKLLPQLIGKLRSPKVMRWDESGVRFARPIRWLLALYGSQLVRFKWGALESQPRTWIGGPLRPKRLSVPSIDGYFKQLERQKILFDHQERQRQIADEVKRRALAAGGDIPFEILSHGLLKEVTFLIERPFFLQGSFDEKHLDLPREVLLASMAKHQRVFAVEVAASKQPLPRWVAILDGKPGKPKAVQAVIEHILNARLADSLLFWKEDQRRSLEEMVEALSGVTFHEKLGSMADKTRRLEALGETLIGIWKVDKTQAENIRRSAHLAKADLVTNLVREFPSLQGVIGKYYARKAGESEDVAIALEQQYWFQELEGQQPTPGSLTGLALTLIEKYDTLASYFGIGIEPTGNADPFGLRPCAQGIVAASRFLPSLAEKSLPRKSLCLTELFNARACFAPFQNMSASEKDRVALRIKEYVFERFYTATLFWKGSRDVINAVTASQDNDDLVDLLERIEILNRLKRTKQLAKPAKVIERTANILKGAANHKEMAVDPARLQEPLEQQLYSLYESNKEAFTQLVKRRSYTDATKLFGETFYDPLHEFFDKVMVNVEDEAIRRNRLALMRAINTLYTDRIADLSKLNLLQPQEES